MHHYVPEDHDAQALHDVELDNGGEREHLLRGPVLPAKKKGSHKTVRVRSHIPEALFLDISTVCLDPQTGVLNLSGSCLTLFRCLYYININISI